MMTYIHQNDHSIAFIKPDNADVHVDAALKEIRGSLNAFCAEGRVRRIFG